MQYTSLGFKKPELTDSADIRVAVGDNMDLINGEITTTNSNLSTANSNLSTHTSNTTNAHGIDNKSPLRYETSTINASRGLTTADANKRMFVDSSSAVEITVPLNSAQAFSVGDEIEFIMYGSGVVSFVATSGAVIRSKDSKLTIGGQYSVVSLLKIGTDEWLLIGSLT